VCVCVSERERQREGYFKHRTTNLLFVSEQKMEMCKNIVTCIKANITTLEKSFRFIFMPFHLIDCILYSLKHLETYHRIFFFENIFFWQKLTNPNCKHTKAVINTFVQKNLLQKWWWNWQLTSSAAWRERKKKIFFWMNKTKKGKQNKKSEIK